MNKSWKIVLQMWLLIVLTESSLLHLYENTQEEYDEIKDVEKKEPSPSRVKNTKLKHQSRYMIPKNILKHRVSNNAKNQNTENNYKSANLIVRSKRKLSKTNVSKQGEKLKRLSKGPGKSRTKKLFNINNEYEANEIDDVLTSGSDQLKQAEVVHDTTHYFKEKRDHIHIRYKDPDQIQADSLSYPRKDSALVDVLINDAQASTQDRNTNMGSFEIKNTTNIENIKSQESLESIEPTQPKIKIITQYSVTINTIPSVVQNVTSAMQPLDTVTNISSTTPTIDDKKKDLSIEKLMSGVVGSNLQSMLDSIPTDIVRIETKFSIKNHNGPNTANNTEKISEKYFLITNIEAEKGEAIKQLNEVSQSIDKVIIVNTSLNDSNRARNQSEQMQQNGTLNCLTDSISQNPQNEPVEHNPPCENNQLLVNQENSTLALNPNVKHSEVTSSDCMKKVIEENRDILKILFFIFSLGLCLAFIYSVLARQEWLELCRPEKRSYKRENDKLKIKINTGVGNNNSYTTFNEKSDDCLSTAISSSCLCNATNKENKKVTQTKDSFKIDGKNKKYKHGGNQTSACSLLFDEISSLECKGTPRKGSRQSRYSEKNSLLHFHWNGPKRSKKMSKPIYYAIGQKEDACIFKELYSAIDSNVKQSKKHGKSSKQLEPHERKSASKRKLKQSRKTNHGTGSKKTDLVAKYCKPETEQDEKEVRCVNYTNSYKHHVEKNPKKIKKQPS